MKSDRPFSIQARLKSFVYAFEGVMYFIKHEAQALIHLIAIVAVIGAGYWFKNYNRNGFNYLLRYNCKVKSKLSFGLF